MLVSRVASHGVQGRSIPEPLELGLVEGVDKLDVEWLAILRVDTEGNGLADSKLGTEKINLVLRLDLVVVGGVSEGQRKHTLLLQVGLVDTSKAAGDDGKTTKVSGFQGGVLTRAALTIVPVTNNNPLDAAGLVVTSSSRNSIVLASEGVLDLVGFTVLSVDSTNKHVVGDVVKMSTVLQPWASHGDVIGGGLALALDENRNIKSILSIPGSKSCQKLETVASGGDGNVDASTLLGRSLVCVTASIVALSRKAVTGRRLEEELIAVLVLKLVGERVELQGTGNGESNDEVGRGDEGVGGGVGIVTASEVTVVGGDNGVGLALLYIMTVPLTNARTTSICKDHTSELFEGLQLAIALSGGTDLLRARGDGEERLGLDAVVKSILSDGRSTRHVLVGRVGARADQADLDLLRPLVGVNSLLELGDGGGKIRGEGAVDMGLKLIQVELDELIVLGTLILTQILGI